MWNRICHIALCDRIILSHFSSCQKKYFKKEGQNQWINNTSAWLHNYRMNGTYIPRNLSVINISQLSSYWTKIDCKKQANFFRSVLIQLGTNATLTVQEYVDWVTWEMSSRSIYFHQAFFLVLLFSALCFFFGGVCLFVCLFVCFLFVLFLFLILFCFLFFCLSLSLSPPLSLSLLFHPNISFLILSHPILDFSLTPPLALKK